MPIRGLCYLMLSAGGATTNTSFVTKRQVTRGDSAWSSELWNWQTLNLFSEQKLLEKGPREFNAIDYLYVFEICEI